MQIIFLFTLIALVLGSDFILHKHQSKNARCLDGSAAALYYQIGQKADNFMIYFEGGGLCRGDGLAAMLQYCYQRSFTHLGSSTNYSDSRSFDKYSYLSSNAEANPFADWTRVFIPYCDGSVHQGSRQLPIQYKQRNLYFRGSNNTLAHFDFLDQQFNLFEAKNIVISGTSAGGLAAFIWSNYVFQRAKNPEGVLIVPDSGQFIVNFPNIYNNKTMLDYTIDTFNIINSETKMPLAQCVQKYPSQVECFQAGNLYEFIKPKTFVLQSQYDSWGLIQILQFKCVPNTSPSNLTKCNDKERAYIERYRDSIKQATLNLSSVPHIGVWAVSCVQHGFLQDSIEYMNSAAYKIPPKTGVTINEALLNFIGGRERKYVDSSSWPDNTGCNGLISQKMMGYLMTE